MAEIRYVDWDGLVYYHSKVTKLIDDRLEDVIKVGGNVTFEELPDPSFQNLNYIYKVTNVFTVPDNGRFDETFGKQCEAGTVLRVTNVNDTYLYTVFITPVSSSGEYDLNDLLLRIEAVESELSGLSDNIDGIETRLDEIDSTQADTVRSIQELTDIVNNLPNEYATTEYVTNTVTQATQYVNESGETVNISDEIRILSDTVKEISEGSIIYGTWE